MTGFTNSLLEGLSAEEFYKLRDERTALMVDNDTRANSCLTLTIGTAESQTFCGQLCFLVLVNLSARWCRHLEIQVPEGQLHPNLKKLFCSASLVQAAHSIALAANPFGLLSLSPIREASSHIHVGTNAQPGAYAVMGCGWLAAAGKGIDFAPEANNLNPLGPILAAVIGSCRTIRQTMKRDDWGNDLRLSLWDYTSGNSATIGPSLPFFDLGRVLIVGTGAIGSGISYVLPLLPARIEVVDLIDADTVDFPNLNRSLLFNAIDVGQPKVGVVARHLQQFGIKVSAIPKWFSEVEPNVGTYDLVIPGANEFGVQHGMMSNYPPLMIGASTGPQWDIHLQRHIPLVDDCLECRLPSVRPKPVLRCGSGDVSPSGDPGAPRQTGALPFLSCAASLLALAEIAKLGIAGTNIPDENGVMLFFKALEPSFMTIRHSKKTNCPHCWNAHIFHQIRSDGKYYYLSKRR